MISIMRPITMVSVSDIIMIVVKLWEKLFLKENQKLWNKGSLIVKVTRKKMFSFIYSLFGSKQITVLPEYTSSFTLAYTINMFFSVPVFSIAIILDCLHWDGILFSMKHLLSIARKHQLGPGTDIL